MTSQKTIERCRARVAELEASNKTLIENNVKLAEENSRLRSEIKKQCETIVQIDSERRNCKSKCEVALSEKDRQLREKEARLAGLKSVFERLRDGKWFYHVEQLPDGKVRIVHDVMPA